MTTRDDVLRRGDRPVAPTVVNMMMTSDLKPYPAYKDSGVSWLGEVPSHWDVSALRRKLRPVDGIKIGPFGSQLKLEQMVPSGYKVYGQANVIAKDFVRGTKFVEQEKFNELSACVVLPGDLLVTMMGTSGRCACVPDDAVMGIMDSHLLRLRTNGSLNVRFVSLLIDESPYVKEQMTVAGKGSIMHGLNSGIVKALVLALPPLPEQTAIVRFLDYADRRIRRYIRAKQKLIALLEEQKQAIIHQAVTGQIDVRTGQPYPSYKPSGVEWLGDVPEHWAMVRNGRIFIQRNEIGFPELPILEVSLKTGVRIRNFENSDRKQVISDRSMYKRAVKGDIAYNMMRMWQGAVGVTPIDGLVSPAYVVAKLLAGTEPRYFGALFRTSAYMAEVDKYSRGIVKDRNRLYWEDFRQIPAPCPPADEQVLIADVIDHSTETLNEGGHHINRQIALLLEYRTRLIADVVTGKLDVREAAAALPEVDPLAEDDLDGTIHDGDNSNLGELGAEESAEEYTIEKEVTV